ncbi:MAG TPA: HAMP domain-containing sensor histidine kinase [Acidimicrobiales bacterium]|nr:HAMP domain-containing sensor histidine kinase [Acidimicrobiales bacterium]
MTLRARLALLTSAAVALAILAASLAAWVLVRSAMLAEVDDRLRERMASADRIADMVARPLASGPMASDRVVLQGEPIGIQVVGPEGAVLQRMGPADVEVPVDSHERRLLAGREVGEGLRTVTIDGESYRVISRGLAGGTLLRLIQPLTRVESTMARIAWLLAAVAGAGVAMAGALGWITARAGLRPVDKLVAAAEQVARTKNLAHRIDMGEAEGGELARLAAAVNSMLAALDQARAQQRELVENAGHELRTPLATLRNDVGLLLRAEQHPERRLPAPDRARLLAALESEAAALSDLVAEVVDLARGDVEPEPLLEADVRAVVDRAAARSRPVNPAVAVTVVGPRVEAPVRPAALERAVANLIRNAVQVSEEGGVVEVVVGEAGGVASVEVLDRGPGIADADLPRLFDRFYRGQDARQRHGSGLGLAIASQVAGLHGGSIEAANRPGGGAVFTLRIPAGGPPPAG